MSGYHPARFRRRHVSTYTWEVRHGPGRIRRSILTLAEDAPDASRSDLWHRGDWAILVAMPTVGLRPVEASDLDAIFEQMRDPVSVQMAAFTTEDPDDRVAFDVHMARVMALPDATLRAITADDRLVGTISSFVLEGVTEVTYWIDRSSWGQGFASRALELLLQDVTVRPLRARVASDNLGSLHVLQRNGFVPVGTEVSYAPARGEAIEETLLELS